eukprot:6463961-Amphidinium_carterae.1
MSVVPSSKSFKPDCLLHRHCFVAQHVRSYLKCFSQLEPSRLPAHFTFPTMQPSSAPPVDMFAGVVFLVLVKCSEGQSCVLLASLCSFLGLYHKG